MKQYAVVGFGCAGYQAAKALRECDANCRIDVYSNTGTAPSNPMLTTYYVAGKIGREGMFPFGCDKDAIVKKLGISLHENTAVEKVRAVEREVVLADGSAKKYDDIVLATGAYPLVPPVAGMPENNIYVMRTPEDADALLQRIESGLSSALVIGASWVGIKVVEALYKHKVPAVMADLAPYIFPTATFPDVAHVIEERLRAKGIGLLFGAGLASMREEEDGVVAVFSDGREVKAEIVVLCLGVRAAVGCLDRQEINIGRGVRVDTHMQTSVPHVYAVGDCCETLEIMSGDYMPVNLWANATIQGRVAGRNINGREEEFSWGFAHNITHFLDIDFVGLGNPKLTGETVEFGSLEHDNYVKAVIKDGKLQCANILGNYRISGSFKSWFLRQQEHPGEAMPTTLRANLLREGLDEEFIALIGGSGV